MRTHQQRISQLGIITTKKGATKFALDCDTGDWSHTFGLDPGNNAIEAWAHRKDINSQLRSMQKEIA